jgi:protocatechuate 3,4-dioxygenase beta subunit
MGDRKMKRSQMDRRRFLGFGGAALAAFACPKSLRAEDCPVPTTRDYYGYGPYYLENAPLRTSLAGANEPGKPLAISGTVTDCFGPVPGATLEVWHATDAGCYIHPSLPACEDHGNPEVSRLWASLASDANGAFAFATIKPGAYLNGSSYRPSHIHFRIRRPATERSVAVDLVTQLYFEGDPYLAGDGGSADPGAKARIIPLVSEGGVLNGTFPLVLPSGSSSLHRPSDPLEDPASRAFDILVQRSGNLFRIFLPPVPAGLPVEARLYDASGILVQRSLHATLPLELDASQWPRQGYLARFFWQTQKGTRSESATLRK